MIKPKIILITGCNNAKGIGFAAAHKLADVGHIAYTTVRNAASAKKLQASTKKSYN